MSAPVGCHDFQGACFARILGEADRGRKLAAFSHPFGVLKGVTFGICDLRIANDESGVVDGNRGYELPVVVYRSVIIRAAIGIGILHLLLHDDCNIGRHRVDVEAAAVFVGKLIAGSHRDKVAAVRATRYVVVAVLVLYGIRCQIGHAHRKGIRRAVVGCAELEVNGVRSLVCARSPRFRNAHFARRLNYDKLLRCVFFCVRVKVDVFHLNRTGDDSVVIIDALGRFRARFTHGRGDVRGFLVNRERCRITVFVRHVSGFVAPEVVCTHENRVVPLLRDNRRRVGVRVITALVRPLFLPRFGFLIVGKRRGGAIDGYRVLQALDGVCLVEIAIDNLNLDGHIAVEVIDFSLRVAGVLCSLYRNRRSNFVDVYLSFERLGYFRIA